MLNINHLPAWVRHTEYCPLKALDIDASEMTIQEYFEVMAYLAILSPELRHAINRALRFTKREALARKKFKTVFQAAPAAVKSIRTRNPAGRSIKPCAAITKTRAHYLQFAVRNVQTTMRAVSCPPEIVISSLWNAKRRKRVRIIGHRFSN